MTGSGIGCIGAILSNEPAGAFDGSYALAKLSAGWLRMTFRGQVGGKHGSRGRSPSSFDVQLADQDPLYNAL